jgi:prepilin-type processing-associated H-X9-DG protein/prepilin-type N-terminal cleavage/methylation domain-containing protein
MVRTKSAFTLVELLVVIGIIALLIAILLPTLSTARRSAQRTACTAKLHNMMLAAQMHVIDHRGYYPIVGMLDSVVPSDVGDPDTSRYDYISYSGNFSADYLLAPITMALAKEMNCLHVLDYPNAASLDLAVNDPSGYSRNFICPSHEAPSDISQYPCLYSGFFNGGYTWFRQRQSYIYNEALLGVDDAYGRLRGKASRVRQATQLFFAADGLGGLATPVRQSSYDHPPANFPMATIYNNLAAAPLTLGDAISGRVYAGRIVVGDAVSFDTRRHSGKINIAFCDGHVETRTASYKDLRQVYVTAP